MLAFSLRALARTLRGQTTTFGTQATTLGALVTTPMCQHATTLIGWQQTFMPLVYLEHLHECVGVHGKNYINVEYAVVRVECTAFFVTAHVTLHPKMTEL